MKKITIFKTLLVSVCILVLPNVLNASKLKSSKNYLKKIDIEVQEFGKNFDSLKLTLKNASQSSSFLSSDFWGIKHNLYVENSFGVITNKYPFSKKWLSQWGSYGAYSSNYVRNINGIVLTPYDGNDKNWFEELQISFNFHPGYYSSQKYHDYIQQYFVSNGIPSSKITAAFAYFGSMVDPVTELILKKTYKRIDRIYENTVLFGDVNILEKIAGNMVRNGSLNLEDFYTPVKHNTLYKKFMSTTDGKDIEQSLQSYKEFYSNYEENYKPMNLWEFYQNIDFKIRIEGYTQWLNVAQGMSKTKKYNHLMKLKEMLDKKVSSGKVNRTQDGAYTIYEDSYGNSKGCLGINFKNGRGYWQDPFVGEKTTIAYKINKIKKNMQSINTTLKNYLAICLDETVKKFKNTTTVTNDF